MSGTEMKCPRCGQTEAFAIAATVWGRYDAVGFDSQGDDLPSYDNEISESSMCSCAHVACNWSGDVGEAVTEWCDSRCTKCTTDLSRDEGSYLWVCGSCMDKQELARESRGENMRLALRGLYPGGNGDGSIVDALTDIRHVCKFYAVDFEAMLQVSQTHFTAETSQGES